MTDRRKSWLSMRSLRRFAKDERGVTAIEFAFVLPVILILLIGCFEVPRFVLVYQRIARTSASVADLVAQADEPITPAQLQDIFTAGKVIMDPYDIKADGRIIVSSINNPAGTGVKMTWQLNNGSSVTVSSKVATAEGSPPTNLPAALTPLSNEEVLVAEVFYNYKPVFPNYIYKGSQLYVVSYTRPRNKNLMTKPTPWPPPGLCSGACPP
jgi:Flp pilus assembly protein TadG